MNTATVYKSLLCSNLPIIHIMYRLQLSLDTMNQRQPLPLPPPFINPLIAQQLLVTNTILHSVPFYAGPVYQGMAQQHPSHDYQYQAPISGPRRNQRQRHQAGPRYNSRTIHESYGTVVENRSTGIDPGRAWIDANKNTGDGKVWRTPSKNPLKSDCDLT